MPESDFVVLSINLLNKLFRLQANVVYSSPLPISNSRWVMARLDKVFSLKIRSIKMWSPKRVSFLLSQAILSVAGRTLTNTGSYELQ